MIFSTITTRTPIQRMSAKQRARLEVRAQIRRAKVKRLGRRCQIQSPICAKLETGLHHLSKLSHCGPDTDANTLLSCNRCNRYIENHPAWAREKGFTL